jgi:hypothetical protein
LQHDRSKCISKSSCKNSLQCRICKAQFFSGVEAAPQLNIPRVSDAHCRARAHAVVTKCQLCRLKSKVLAR